MYSTTTPNFNEKQAIFIQDIFPIPQYHPPPGLYGSVHQREPVSESWLRKHGPTLHPNWSPVSLESHFGGCAPGRVHGELCIYSIQLISDYWKQPQNTTSDSNQHRSFPIPSWFGQEHHFPSSDPYQAIVRFSLMTKSWQGWKRVGGVECPGGGGGWERIWFDILKCLNCSHFYCSRKGLIFEKDAQYFHSLDNCRIIWKCLTPQLWTTLMTKTWKKQVASSRRQLPPSPLWLVIWHRTILSAFRMTRTFSIINPPPPPVLRGGVGPFVLPHRFCGGIRGASLSRCWRLYWLLLEAWWRGMVLVLFMWQSYRAWPDVNSS